MKSSTTGASGDVVCGETVVEVKATRDAGEFEKFDGIFKV
jgi:hypothetical protein